MRFTKQSALRILSLVLIGFAIFYILKYLILAFQRMPYQFEIQILEGAMLDQVRRVVEGQALYVAPSLEFTPFFYPPLFFYVSAIVAKIIGLNFFSLRLVSFVASIGCFLVIYLFVRKETKSNYAGIISAGIFAATYHLSGDWFDIARVDILFLFFLLLSIYFLRFSTSWKSQVAAGIFVTLSFLTKQTALLALIPLILVGFILYKNKSMPFIITTIALTTFSTIILSIASDNWFMYYLFLASEQPFLDFFNLSVLSQPYFLLLPVAWGALVYYLYKTVTKKQKKDFIYLFIALSLLIPSWISKVHTGGELNVLLPMYAGLAIFTGIATSELLKQKEAVVKICVCIVLILQFTLLNYDASTLVPSEDDLRIGQETLELVAGIDGDVFIPAHNYILPMVGKNKHANGMAMYDILRANNHQASMKLKKELADAIKFQKFDAIIFDEEPSENTRVLLQQYYTEQRVFVNETGFITVSGVRSRPSSLFVPLIQIP